MDLTAAQIDEIAAQVMARLDAKQLPLLPELALAPAWHEDLTQNDVPDALWPSDNEYGIPALDPASQAEAFHAPIMAWGAKISRNVRRQNCTLHFYTEDYRFEALWKDPSRVVSSGALTAIEPNFSVFDDMPMAVALWQTYRKRWLARWWQSRGVRIAVDLNVSERWAA